MKDLWKTSAMISPTLWRLSVILVTVPLIASQKPGVTSWQQSQLSFILHGYTLHRADCSPEWQPNRQVYFIINQRLCNESWVLSTTCAPELETLIIYCKPYKLPAARVYPPCHGECVHPTPGQLAGEITAVKNSNPDSFVLIRDDFNTNTLS